MFDSVQKSSKRKKRKSAGDREDEKKLFEV